MSSSTCGQGLPGRLFFPQMSLGCRGCGYVNASDRGLVGRTLKLIAGVAKRRDVPDLKTGLLPRQYSSRQTHHGGNDLFSRRLFLTSDDWRKCKDNPIPSRDLFVEELYPAGVHLSSAGEKISITQSRPYRINQPLIGPRRISYQAFVVCHKTGLGRELAVYSHKAGGLGHESGGCSSRSWPLDA